MIKPRLFARRVVQTILVLVGALGVGIAEAGPGDQILRYPFPATSVFALIDVQPSVAVGVNGDFAVVWASHVQGLDQGIWGRRFGRDGAPQGDQFRVSPPHSNINPQDEAPVIAMDLDGDFVVVWLTVDFASAPPKLSVFGQRFKRTGEPEGAALPINTVASDPVRPGPAIAMDADGDFVVGWMARNPDFTADGFVRRFSATGVPRGSEFRVAAQASSIFPKVAMNASGNFVVTWLQSQPSPPGALKGRRFNSNGVAQGGEFIVAASDASDAVVAMDNTGNFVVAYNKFFRGESKGIFARRFNALGAPQGAEIWVSKYGRLPFRGETAVDMSADGALLSPG